MLLWIFVSCPLVSASMYRAGVVQMYPRIGATAVKTNEANLEVAFVGSPCATHYPRFSLKLIGTFVYVIQN